MFDINNARDFYQKLLEDFDDFMQQLDLARHAMNCAVTAHHMADWVWGDFVKGDAALKAKLGVKDKNGFMAWIDSQTVWYGLVQSISNGSKHFIRENGGQAPKRCRASVWAGSGRDHSACPTWPSKSARPSPKTWRCPCCSRSSSGFGAIF